MIRISYFFIIFCIGYGSIIPIPLSAEMEVSIIKKKSVNKDFFCQFYQVHSGDSLYSIAGKFQVSVKKIMEWNHLHKESRLMIGQKIKIFSKSRINGRLSDRVIKKRHKELKIMDKLIAVAVTGGETISRERMKLIKKNSFNKNTKKFKPLNIYTCNANVFFRVLRTGEVLRKGIMRGYGPYVIIKHRNNTESIYTGLNDIRVTEGEIVNQGKILGRCNGREVGLMVLKDGHPVNPNIFF